MENKIEKLEEELKQLREKLEKLEITPTRKLTLMEILDYEIRSSIITPHCYFAWNQYLAAKYYLWKSKIKHKRYETYKV